MICYFRIIAQEAGNFTIELKIDGDSSFYSLHDAIQKRCKFSSHQLASFFIPDKKSNRLVEVSLLDFGINGAPFFSMRRTKISELITPQTDRLYYTFDFFNDRSLNILLIGIDMEKNLHEPLIILEEGDVPVQILEEDVEIVESCALQEDEVFQDFGVLEDYTKIFGEMDPI